MKEKYDEIIHLPHPTSKKYPRMSRQNRAAQFSPFAALTGYDIAIREEERITEEKRILSEDAMAELNQKISLLMREQPRSQKIRITYFQKDNIKDGGRYIQEESYFKMIQSDEKLLILLNGIKVCLYDIVEIEFLTLEQ